MYAVICRGGGDIVNAISVKMFDVDTGKGGGMRSFVVASTIPIML